MEKTCFSLNLSFVHKIPLIFIFTVSLIMQNNLLSAGELDDFEKDATKQKTGQEDTRESSENKKEPGLLDDLFSDLLSEIFSDFLHGLYNEGRASWIRMNGGNQILGISSRKIGEPLLPIFRADLNYLNVKSDVMAIDGKVEAGYGPYGFQFRRTHFTEDLPKDKLDLDQFHGLIRFSSKGYLEVDVGIGAIILKGDETNLGFSFTLPLKIYPTQWVGLNFIPTWSIINGNAISNYDLLLPFTRRFFSINAGYRWLNSSNESLNGPYLGVSFHY